MSAATLPARRFHGVRNRRHRFGRGLGSVGHDFFGLALDFFHRGGRFRQQVFVFRCGIGLLAHE